MAPSFCKEWSAMWKEIMLRQFPTEADGASLDFEAAIAERLAQTFAPAAKPSVSGGLALRGSTRGRGVPVLMAASLKTPQVPWGWRKKCARVAVWARGVSKRGALGRGV